MPPGRRRAGMVLSRLPFQLVDQRLREAREAAGRGRLMRQATDGSGHAGR
jgi:hypothetical protein